VRVRVWMLCVCKHVRLGGDQEAGQGFCKFGSAALFAAHSGCLKAACCLS